jgi:hypothetical protein
MVVKNAKRFILPAFLIVLGVGLYLADFSAYLLSLIGVYNVQGFDNSVSTEVYNFYSIIISSFNILISVLGVFLAAKRSGK